MTPPTPHDDTAAHEYARSLTDADLTSAVRDLLGAKLVAYILGAHSTQTVSSIVEGTTALDDPDGRLRLTTAYQAARFITAVDSNRVAQVWFQGQNPHLGDQAPARVLVENEPGPAAASVIDAARRYL